MQEVQWAAHRLTDGRPRDEAEALNGFRLKGLLIYSPRGLIGKSGKQEGARFPQQFPDFPLSRFKKEGDMPINQHSMKAGLRLAGRGLGPHWDVPGDVPGHSPGNPS